MVTTRRRTQARLLEEKKQRGAASARKVFDIAELLEKILLDVDDMRTVLLAQRVDKMFQATIEGSVLLKKKLWMLPDSADAEVELNPLLEWSGWFVDKPRLLPFMLTGACDSDVEVDARIQDLFTLDGSWEKMIIARQQGSRAVFPCNLYIHAGRIGSSFTIDQFQDQDGNLRAADVMDRMRQLARERFGETFNWEGLLVPPGEFQC